MILILYFVITTILGTRNEVWHESKLHPRPFNEEIKECMNKLYNLHVTLCIYSNSS